ncbi:endonuclease III [bacterium]|nr:endonuclease III [candidate division CSSED10-310 bacterium]
MKESRETRKRRLAAIIDRLEKAIPDAGSALDYTNPLQCLVATILSAQCTDARVNMVTPSLFKKYPTVRAFAEADRVELENEIRSTGFFRNKAKSIQSCCRELLDVHGGRVPDTMAELIALEGVGRKTANCVLANAYAQPAVMVDTHVIRLSGRMGLTRETNPDKIEIELKSLLPRERWTPASHLIIHHGRRTCTARKPGCDRCVISGLCPRIGI